VIFSVCVSCCVGVLYGLCLLRFVFITVCFRYGALVRFCGFYGVCPLGFVFVTFFIRYGSFSLRCVFVTVCVRYGLCSLIMCVF